jgi:glyoxylase-like metal-dependent hydrolase (beta-lactamase superfamily II)
MYELISVGEQTYYIDCPAKVGVYKTTDKDVYLIDSGNDKDAGRKILKILKANDWSLQGIINTHSNADHTGGNKFLQQRTGCKIISTPIENMFARFPILEPSFLYGGYPFKELRNKFLMANACEPTHTVDEYLPMGMEYIRLGGHYFDMIGIKTADDVWFLADCVFSKNIISKYHLSFVYDVKAFLNTLDLVEQLQARLFIPAHADPCQDIRPLVKVNRNKVHEIIDQILSICTSASGFEDILQSIFNYYELTMDFNQYVLVGSTVRSYLSYLHDEGKLECVIRDNKMLWQTVHS